MNKRDLRRSNCISGVGAGYTSDDHEEDERNSDHSHHIGWHHQSKDDDETGER